MNGLYILSDPVFLGVDDALREAQVHNRLLGLVVLWQGLIVPYELSKVFECYSVHFSCSSTSAD